MIPSNSISYSASKTIPRPVRTAAVIIPVKTMLDFMGRFIKRNARIGMSREGMVRLPISNQISIMLLSKKMMRRDIVPTNSNEYLIHFSDWFFFLPINRYRVSLPIEIAETKENESIVDMMVANRPVKKRPLNTTGRY